MWNEPTKEELRLVPDLYSTEDTPCEEKKIYLKFFLGGWTWYVAEISHEDWNTMFGFVTSPLCPEGEWGYTSLTELKDLKVGGIEVDRDLYTVTPQNPQSLKTIS